MDVGPSPNLPIAVVFWVKPASCAFGSADHPQLSALTTLVQAHAGTDTQHKGSIVLMSSSIFLFVILKIPSEMDVALRYELLRDA